MIFRQNIQMRYLFKEEIKSLTEVNKKSPQNEFIWSSKKTSQ